ncbi:MAG TPA: hypothetical protein VHG32_08740 [Thermoanaerobaculia bacterium]|nr:hypothetical protein [Thermoanaerobaculia bacterium]
MAAWTRSSGATGREAGTVTSEVFDLGGVVKALSEAAAFIRGEGGEASWLASPANAEAGRKQRELLRRLEAVRADLARIPELEAWASLVAAELNAILAREGFGIQLADWPQDGQGFGVVAILDLTVHWIETGAGDRQIRIAANPRGGDPGAGARSYPAFALDVTANGIGLFEAPGGGAPLIRIPTRSGDVVWIHQTPWAPRSFDLYDEAARLQAGRGSAAAYGSVVEVTLPKIQLRREADISWLAGMTADRFIVQEARQEVRFAMNEEGARAKTATALGVRGAILQHIVVNDDFLLWIERPGLSIPVFAGYLAKHDAWRDPGSLANV